MGSLTYSNIGRTLSYHYDGAGNISQVLDSQNSTAVQTDYLYDGLNQLIRVNDSAAGKTTTYTYDAIGNRHSIKYNGSTYYYYYNLQGIIDLF